MIQTNKLGGIEDDRASAIERAKAVDLITLPKDIKGTNCFNCKYITLKKEVVGYCVNKEVLQNVNSRMCCALWDAQGTLRGWKS